MRYYDEKAGRFRETLEHYLEPGETHESVIHDANCLHRWQRCVHNGVNSLGDQAVCVEVSFYLTYSHFVCAVCGEERYPQGWGAMVSKILETRRLVTEWFEESEGAD